MSDIEQTIDKVTFLSKDKITCPICDAEFYREQLRSGGGRLIAGDITDTLHRKYKPSQKFGQIYPLIYPVVVCPDCFYAAYREDFNNVLPENLEKLENTIQYRIDLANKVAGEIVDFSKYRTLESGAASYVLAIYCYDFFGKKTLPVIKQAIAAMRAAYLFEELDETRKGKYFDFLVNLFYKKALFFYQRAIELNQSQVQIMENMKNFGPDLDKNYGYDSVTYLIALLTFKYDLSDDEEIRNKQLDDCKMYFGKLFGMGKANVNKPKEILEKSKDFYEQINKELKKDD